MDPIGLGLERFDGLGRYREAYGNGDAIDPQGNLPDGTAFSGPGELGSLLGKDPRFNACVASKLYTYALGRAPDPTAGHMDTPALEALAAELVDSGYSLPALIQAVVQSPTFMNRRGEP